MLAGKLRKAGTTLWDNKKKALFFSGVAAVLADYGRKRYIDAEILAEYCRRAVVFGDATIGPVAEQRPRRVTVLANRWAADARAKSNYEKYAKPLLNLAGLQVDLVEASSADQLADVARAIDANDTDALLIVGGDGTIAKALSARLDNRATTSGAYRPLPIGFFPAGRNNYTCKNIWTILKDQPVPENRVVWLCETVMDLINDVRSSMLPMKVTLGTSAPQVALSGVHWGPHRDAQQLRWRYWYTGGWIKGKLAYLRTWPASVRVQADSTPPCSGCRSCVAVYAAPRRSWWSLLFGSSRMGQPLVDYSKITNESCGMKQHTEASTTEVLVELQRVKDKNHTPMWCLISSFGEDYYDNYGVFSFWKDGWLRDNAGSRKTLTYPRQIVQARTLTLSCVEPTDELPKPFKRIGVDGEAFDISPEDSVSIEIAQEPLTVFA